MGSTYLAIEALTAPLLYICKVYLAVASLYSYNGSQQTIAKGYPVTDT